MKLTLQALEDVLEEVYPPKVLAEEIDRRVEEQIAKEVADEVTVFNVWLHKHGVLGRLRSGELSLVSTEWLNSPVSPLHYHGPLD